MKELLNKKNRLILIMIVFMILAGVFGIGYGQYYKSSHATTFEKNGYIVNVNPQAESAKYMFKSGQAFSKSFNNNFEFVSSEGEEVVLKNDSFLFYDDGNITSLSKGVLLDIPEIASGNHISHYSLLPFMEVSERNGYEVENGEDPLKLSEILWKTSESKYLVLSKSLKVYFGEDDIRDVSDYVEINYIDAGVVQLVTKDNVWQTVSEDVKIITEDGAVIHLVKEIVEFKDKQMLLSKLVLDSSENIELSPYEQKTQFVPEFDITGQDGSSGSSGNDGEDGIKAENGLNGNVGGHGSDGEDGVDGEDGLDATIDSTFNTALPQIVLNSWEVDATSFKGKYRVEDENNLLKVNSSLKISLIETKTNRSFEVVNVDGGSDFGINHQSEYEFMSSTTLKPDSEYKLVISGVYVINESEHQRDFLTKIFYTDSLGILVEKNPSEIDKVSFKITKKDYAVAKKATLYLLTEEENMKGFDPEKNEYLSQEIDLTKESSDVVFDNLPSNTKYIARLTVTVEKNHVEKVYTSQQILETMTLKKAPIFNFAPVAISNRRDWLFELYGGNVTDPDKAIVQYVYEVYDVESGNLVKSVNVLPNRVHSASYLYIDNVSIYPGKKYNFIVRAIYNDNEKNVEVVSNSSSDFMMEGTQLPAVHFVESEDGIKPDSISGELVINLNKSKIDLDNLYRNPITVVMTCEGVYSKTLTFKSRENIRENGDQLILSINETGLNQNRLYRFDVEAFVDYIGNGEKYERTNIGHVVKATPHLANLKALWDDNMEIQNHAFAVKLKLDTEGGNFENLYDSSILGMVEIGLYDVDNKLVGNTKVFENTKDMSDQLFNSVLKEQFVEEGVVITEETFDLTPENLPQDIYFIKINGVYDYTVNVDLTVENSVSAKLIDYYNEYEVKDAVFEVKKSSTVPKLPSPDDLENQIIVNPIVNSSAEKYGQLVNPDLPSNAIIGYKIDFNYNNVASLARKIHLYGFDTDQFTSMTNQIFENNQLKETGDFMEHKVIPVDMGAHKMPSIALIFGEGNDGSVYDNNLLYYTKTMKRGEIYKFAYAVEYADDVTVKDPKHVYPYHTDQFNDFPPGIQEKYVLQSKNEETPKATPVFYMYTFKKDDNTFSLKYMYRDYDGAMRNEDGTYHTQYSVNGSGKNDLTLEKNPYISTGASDFWGDLEVSGVKLNDTAKLNFTFDWHPFNGSNTIQSVKVSVPYTNIQKTNEADLNKVKFELDASKINKNILLLNISDTSDQLRNVVGISLEFKNDKSNKTVTYPLPYISGIYDYSISLSRIADVIGEGKITAVPTLYYDTGNEGWDFATNDKKQHYALQLFDGRYLAYNTGTNANEIKGSGAGSLYSTGGSLELDKIIDRVSSANLRIIPFLNDGAPKTFTLQASSGNLLLNGDNFENITFIPKQVNNVAVKSTNEVTITKVIPSVDSTNDKLIREQAMNYVILDGIKVYGFNSIPNKKVNFALYDSSNNRIHEYNEIPLTNCDASKGYCTLDDILIDELQPNTTYYVKMEGLIQGDANKTLFIDAADDTGSIWSLRIQTSKEAQLNELTTPKFVYETYNNKYISVGYGISQIKDLKVVYDILDAEGNTVLSSFDPTSDRYIETDLQPVDYGPTKNSDKLHINQAWFVGSEDKTSILQYDVHYTLQYRLVRIDENGDYVYDENGSPILMGQSRQVDLVFKANEQPLIFDDMWITTETEFGKEKMYLNINISAINDPNKVIMTGPENEDGEVDVHYYAFLYKIVDEEEQFVQVLQDEKNQDVPYLDASTFHKFSIEVGQSEVYLLRLYAAVDLNNDGMEDDYMELKNNSITSLTEEEFVSHMKDLQLYERDPYYTPDSNGISLGVQSLGASTIATNMIAVTYKDAVNINDIDRVTFNVVQDGTGSVFTGELLNDDPMNNPLFVPRSGGYYTLDLPFEISEHGTYHITVEYECLNDAGIYVLQSRYSDKYVY